MKRRKIYDPYSDLVTKLARGGVKYVIVGMSGINYYASRAQDTFATQDFDIFIKPTIKNVTRAVSICRGCNYSMVAENKALEAVLIKQIVRRRNTIIATDSYGVAVEFILAVSGYTFNEMSKDASIFLIDSVPIKVAKLQKLLQSKKIAGRKKDKLFLKRYAILLKENGLD